MAENELSRDTLYRASPTIRINQQADAKVTNLLNRMRITESEGGMSAAEIGFDNLASDMEGGADLAFEDESILKLGATLAVYGGDENSPQEIFRGIITGIEATFSADGPDLLVLAEDALLRARMARRTLVHDDVSISDLANDLAGRLSLRPVITGFTDRIGQQVQFNESDLAFLRRLLAAQDGDLQVVGDELHVSPRKDVQRGTLELELHSQLHRARIMVDLAHQVTQVTAGGWNAADGRKTAGTSQGANRGPGSGRSGADMLRDAVGDRSEHLGEFSAVTDDEAAGLAGAAFDRRSRRFVCVDATAEGNPALRVGTHVTLKGLSRRFENTYYVVRACHRYDRTRGYETDFEAECAYLGNV